MLELPDKDLKAAIINTLKISEKIERLKKYKV